MDPTALVFPHYNEMDDYEEEFKDNYVEVEHPLANLPTSGYVLVPAKNVIVKKKKTAATAHKNGAHSTADPEEEWNEMTQRLAEEIESAVPMKKRFAVNNIARSVLRNKDFFISPSGTMTAKGHSKSQSAILDYCLTASRNGGPNEKADPNFLLFTKLLLKSHMPKQYVKNKSLLHSSSRVSKRSSK
jgi:hypothetical protein